MSPALTLFRREFLGYFRTAVAYVFLIVFLLLAVGLTWYLLGFFAAGQADLQALFNILPWVLLFLVPAVGMRLWAEERRSGTWELLFTMPINATQAVLAKFFAGWAFLTLAILLTLPLAFTAEYLGNPDWGMIVSGYFGLVLLAGSYLAICSLASSFTRSQVIAFVLGVVICALLLLLGTSFINEPLSAVFPVWLVDAIANFSFLTHFQQMMVGLVTFADVLFFLALTAVSLGLNMLVLQR